MVPLALVAAMVEHDPAGEHRQQRDQQQGHGDTHDAQR
jgi:hypothetical protein